MKSPANIVTASDILEDVFCKPKTESDWNVLGIKDEGCYLVTAPWGKPKSVQRTKYYDKRMTEIPVGHFMALVNDRLN